MLRGYRLFFAAAFGFLVLGQCEQGWAAQQGNSDKQQSANPAAAPKPPHTPGAEQAKPQCYPGSDPGVSCDGIAAKAAVDQARDADKQAAPIGLQLGVGVGTLIAAIFAAIFAWRAAHHTKRSADIAQDTAKRQLRAYVDLGEFDKSALIAGRPFRVSATFINSGQTPAYSAKILITCTIGTLPVPEHAFDLVDRGGDESTCSVPPTVPTRSFIELGEITTEQIAEIESGKARVYCHGLVRYVDIFGEPHETEFRYQLIRGLFVACETGNRHT